MSTRPARGAPRRFAAPHCRLLCRLLCALLLPALSASFAGAQAIAELTDLSTTERIGTLLLPRISGGYLPDDDPELQRLRGLAREGRIGGAVLFAGDPLSTRHTIERLQAAAPHRLLFGLDAEWGAAMRLDGATRWPRAMAVGATRDPELARAMGVVTAREARALGIDLVLAPVADLALRADNRVIGSRAFDGDPERAAAMVAAFVEGVRSQGALAVVKHFPGHGATDVDSHAGLPVLDSDLELLRSRDLIPFRAAIDTGVDAVMPGHLALPAIDPSGLPASLSPALLGDVLRGELGFEGLIVSDALDMQGARTFAWDGRVAAQALAAGIDLLLLPTHPEAALAEIERAIARGDVSPERLADAATRVLAAQRRLAATPALPPSQVGAVGEAELVARVASEAITVVGDPGSLPLDSRQPPAVAVIELDHHPERRTVRPLLRALARRAHTVHHVRLRPGSEQADLNAHRETLLAADALLVVLQLGGPDNCVGERCGGLNEARAQLFHDLARLQNDDRPAVLISLADPWPLLSEDAARFDGGRLAAYDGHPAIQEAVAAALFGEWTIGGHLPLPAQPQQPSESAVSPLLHVEFPADPFQQLRNGPPEVVGMSSGALERAAAILRTAVDDGTTPSAVALVARRGVVVFERAFGRLAEAESLPEGMQLDDEGLPPAATVDTLYGLASLTKVVAATTVTMRLVEQGRLQLHAPVVGYLPEFARAAPTVEDAALREQMTVRHLLTHSSGLLWWTDLHLRHGVQGGNSFEQARSAYLEEIYRLPLESAPGEKVAYSDLGILLLSEILERVTATPYHELVQREVLEPLAMSQTTFQPVVTRTPDLAATEFDAWRERIVWGEVHDENAAGLAGLAPHAGLFSTARDLARLNQMLLAGGAFEGQRYLNGATIAEFTTRDPALPEGATRALGWDTPSAKSNGGQYVSERAFGHTGFTGTSIWIDPEFDLQIVLLTNRVHPTRDDIRIRELRPAFHDAVLRSITDREMTPRPGSEPR